MHICSEKDNECRLVWDAIANLNSFEMGIQFQNAHLMSQSKRLHKECIEYAFKRKDDKYIIHALFEIE